MTRLDARLAVRLRARRASRAASRRAAPAASGRRHADGAARADPSRRRPRLTARRRHEGPVRGRLRAHRSRPAAPAAGAASRGGAAMPTAGAEPGPDWIADRARHLAHRGRPPLRRARAQPRHLARSGSPVNARIEFDAVSESTGRRPQGRVLGRRPLVRDGALVHERDELPDDLRRLAQHVPRPRAHQRARERPQGDHRRHELRRPARKAGRWPGRSTTSRSSGRDGKTVKMVGRRQRDADVPGHRPARRRRARPLRLQRLGSEGLLRQREASPLP